MPNYIRRYAADGTFFFTVVTHRRRRLFSSEHGLVRCPHQWPYSSFEKWVEEGYYGQDWLCDCRSQGIVVPDDLRQGETFGE